MITIEQVNEAKDAMEKAKLRFHTLLDNYNIQERGTALPMDVTLINYVMRNSK